MRWVVIDYSRGVGEQLYRTGLAVAYCTVDNYTGGLGWAQAVVEEDWAHARAARMWTIIQEWKMRRWTLIQEWKMVDTYTGACEREMLLGGNHSS